METVERGEPEVVAARWGVCDATPSIGICGDCGAGVCEEHAGSLEEDGVLCRSCPYRRTLTDVGVDIAAKDKALEAGLEARREGPGKARKIIGVAVFASVKATLQQGWGYGVYLRATDPEAADVHIFQYDPKYGRGAFLFRKIVDGREKGPFAKVWAPEGYDWFGKERDIGIDAVGDEFTAYIDGEEVLTASDSTCAKGGIGLRTWCNSVADFDDITVETIE